MDICIKDASVSGHHADLIKSERDGRVVYILRDNNSSNGTRINNIPITEQELAARLERLAQEEKERIALDAITADKVVCGEQQPESDHFIQMEQASAGDDEGLHWREARGWFSYRLKTNGKKAAQVRIAYRPEPRRDARVYVNEVEVGVLADGGNVAAFAVPASLQTAEVLTVKIAKGDKRITPHVYEVRLTE